MTMTDEASPPTATAYAVSLKLPDPELWFAQAEALFTAQNVTQEKTAMAMAMPMFAFYRPYTPQRYVISFCGRQNNLKKSLKLN